MDICQCLARADPRKCFAFWTQPGRSPSLQIYRGTFVLCVPGVCPESATAPPARATAKQRRGEAVAASTVAGNIPGNFVRGAACLYFLPRLFLASAYQRPLSVGEQSYGAFLPPCADACCAVSAGRVLGADHLEAANLHSRAHLF